MLEKFTFGNSKSCVTLVKLLNEANDKQTTRYVTRFISSINETISYVEKIEHPRVRQFILNMLNDYCKNRRFKNVDETIQSFARNVALIRVKRAKKIHESVRAAYSTYDELIKENKRLKNILSIHEVLSAYNHWVARNGLDS